MPAHGRPPAHAVSHEPGGSDPVVGVPPGLHAATHEDVGADEIDVGGLSGLLADGQTPLGHEGSHRDGGADEIELSDLAGTDGAPGDIPESNGAAVAWVDPDGRYDPAAHAASHADGQPDEIELDALAGAAGAAGEIPETDGAAVTWVEPDGRYTPAVHGAAQHTDVTREVFLPANEGFVSSGTPGATSYYARVQGAANLDEPKVNFAMKTPTDFVSFISVRAVWSSPAAAGNMWWGLNARYAASGESILVHTETLASGATATGGANIRNVQEPVNPLVFGALTAEDYIGIYFTRAGSNASDTLDDVVNLLGLIFTYTAEQ